MTEAKKTTKTATKTTTKTTKTAKVATKTTATKKASPEKTSTRAVATTLPNAKLTGAIYATGKRKDSVARVYMKPGKGTIIINNKPINDYFRRPVLQMIIAQPFNITKRDGAYDVFAMVLGGGLSGQAGAVKHGISKALEKAEPDLRKPLKTAGFLTRDSRVVERKHYGFHKARRSTQFSKR